MDLNIALPLGVVITIASNAYLLGRKEERIEARIKFIREMIERYQESSMNSFELCQKRIDDEIKHQQELREKDDTALLMQMQSNKEQISHKSERFESYNRNALAAIDLLQQKCNDLQSQIDRCMAKHND